MDPLPLSGLGERHYGDSLPNARNSHPRFVANSYNSQLPSNDSIRPRNTEPRSPFGHNRGVINRPMNLNFAQRPTIPTT